MSRLLSVVGAVLVAGAAVAQPAAPAPHLAVARVKGEWLVWATTVAVPVQKEVAVTVLVNGQQVVEKRTVTVLETVTREESVKLKDVLVTDGAGRAIPADRLGERLGKGAAVVLNTGRIPDIYRRVFKDDAVLVELPEALQPPR
jgi:hypothetical protein